MANIQIALSNQYLFNNASNNDVVFFTSNNSQNILIGNTSNNAAGLLINSNSIFVPGNVNFGGVLMQNGTPYIGSQWSNNLSNVFLMGSNVGIGKMNPTFPLDVAGDLNFEGVLRQGGVPYIGSQWSNNSNNVFLFGSNVGIGTSNPQATLDVLGTVNISSNLNLASGVIIQGLDVTINTGSLANITNTAIVGFSNEQLGINFNMSSNNASNYFRYTASNVELMRVTGTGNVGIGKSNPAFPLDVKGDLNFSGTLRQGGVPYVGSQWSNNSSNVFLMSSNVGIGKMNPAFSLDIAGTLYVSSNVTIGGSLTVCNSEIINSNLTVLNNATINGNLGIGKLNPSYPLDVSGNISVSNIFLNMNNGGYISLFQANNMLFNNTSTTIGNSVYVPQYGLGFSNFTTCIAGYDGISMYSGAQNTPMLRINNWNTVINSNLYVNGNVGIGTSNPLYNLDVKGTINLNKSGTINNKLLVLYDVNSNDALLTACNFYGFGINGGTLRYQVPSSNQHEWYNGANAVMILKNENCGIGTNSPSNLLTVFSSTPNNSYIAISSLIGGLNNTVGLFLNTWSDGRPNSNSAKIVAIDDSYKSMHLAFYTPPTGSATSITTERMRITSSGDVGIGTSTPQYNLDVTGNIRSTGIIYTDSGHICANISPLVLNTTNTGSIFLRSTITNGNINAFSNIATLSTNSHRFYTNNNIALQINASGNVGIGTTTPQSSLDVRGTTYIGISNANTQIAIQDKEIKFQGTRSAHYSIFNSNGLLSFNKTSASEYPGVYGTPMMCLNSSGYVGIGTTTPGSSYSGTITAPSIIDLNGQIILKNDSGWTQGGIRFRSLNGTVDAAIVQGTNGCLYFRSPTLDGTNGCAWVNSAGTTNMTLTNSGNLGIGTSSPQYPLDVNGVVRCSSLNTPILNLSSYTTFNGSAFQTEVYSGATIANGTYSYTSLPLKGGTCVLFFINGPGWTSAFGILNRGTYGSTALLQTGSYSGAVTYNGSGFGYTPSGLPGGGIGWAYSVTFIPIC